MTDATIDLKPIFTQFETMLGGIEANQESFVAHIDLHRTIRGMDDATIESVRDAGDAIVDPLDGLDDAHWQIDVLDQDEGPTIAWWSLRIVARSPEARTAFQELLRDHTPWRGEDVRLVAYEYVGTEGPMVDLGEAGVAILSAEMYERAKGRRLRVVVEDLGPIEVHTPAPALVDQSPPTYDEADEPHYEALSATGFFGRQGAGVVPIARSTGRMLLNLRSPLVLEPGTYGNCGGARHEDETPEDAAMREFRQETGWNGNPGDTTLIPAYVFRSGGFVYHNFFVLVDDEFDPMLGWEATGHVWTTPEDALSGRLDAPLHYGIQALLADPDSLAVARGGWR